MADEIKPLSKKPEPKPATPDPLLATSFELLWRCWHVLLAKPSPTKKQIGDWIAQFREKYPDYSATVEKSWR